MSKIPVDSIELPERFVAICKGWYENVNCPMFAVASTGGVTTETREPPGCDTPEEWYLTLWRDLSYAVGRALKDPGSDYAVLVDFQNWIDRTVTLLEGDYNLVTWEPWEWGCP
jgi:hypothetical protein